MTDSDHPHIGIVAIGRNEGERLERCLRSSIGDGVIVVYVDSGSTDGSVSLARSIGAEVVELDTTQGFTAARARNAGLHRLLAHAPDVQYVQFIDGDCEMVPGWMEAASAFLQNQEDYAVVCGRRREVVPHRNIYHRLTDMEWDTPIGPTLYCGGDALMRVAPLKELNGYRDSLIAGEEPELCVRLRQAGWSIYRMDREMTRHDIRMDSWKQWWKRAVRAGHAFAEGAKLHGAPPERHWVREHRSLLLWGLVFPTAAILLAWPTQGVSVAVMAALYAALFAKAAIATYRQRDTSVATALLYAAHCVAAKFPQACGGLLYEMRRRTGRRATLVEYRRPPVPASEEGDRSPRDRTPNVPNVLLGRSQ